MEIIANEKFQDYSKYSLIILNILLLIFCVILIIVISRKQKHSQKKLRTYDADVIFNYKQ